MDNSIKKILKKYLEEKNFSKYNEVLEIEITSYFVDKIREKKPSYLYSTLVELLEIVEKYLDERDIIICTHFYDLCERDYTPEVLANYLTDVYEKIAL